MLFCDVVAHEMSDIRVLDILVVSLISLDVRRTNSRRRRKCMMPSLAALQYSELGGTGAGTKREGEGVTREGQEEGPSRRCFFVVMLVFDGDFVGQNRTRDVHARLWRSSTPGVDSTNSVRHGAMWADGEMPLHHLRVPLS